MTAPTPHDVVVGPAGPIRRRAVLGRIAHDLIHQATECWLIDVYRTHQDSPFKTARSLAEARSMLAGLNKYRPKERGDELCITIENAYEVLRDQQIRASIEDVMRGRATATIRFRLAVPDRTVASFGGSKVIRDEVLAGNIIEAVSR